MMRTLRFTALALIAFVRAAEGDSTIAPVVVTAAGGGVDPQAGAVVTAAPTVPATAAPTVPATAAPTTVPASADLISVKALVLNQSVLTEMETAVSAIEACATTLETAGTQKQAPCLAAFQENTAKAVGETCGAQAEACEEGKLCPACKTADCHAALRGINETEIERIAAACSDFEKAATPLIEVFVGCVDTAVGSISDPDFRAAFKADFETPPKPDTPTSPEQLRFELFKFANECGLRGLTLRPPSPTERAAQAKQASQKVSRAKLLSAQGTNAQLAAISARTEEQTKLVKLFPGARLYSAIKGKEGQAARDAAKAVAVEKGLDVAAVDRQVVALQEKEKELAAADAKKAELKKSVASAEASQAAVRQVGAEQAEAPSSGASAVAATAAAAAAVGFAMLC